MVIFKQFNKNQRVFFCLGLTFFTLPLSVSLKSVFLLLTILTLFSGPEIWNELKQVFREPWCKATLWFFSLILLGSLMGEADWKSKITFINKYSKILYLPLLAIAFKEKRNREIAIHAFIFAMVITCLLYILKPYGWLDIGQNDYAILIHNHITTGYFMAFAAFLTVLYALRYQRYVKFAYIALSLLFSFFTLYVNSGRTGYLVYAILFIVFLLQCVPLRKAPLYFLLILPMVTFTAYKSVIFNQRIHEAVRDVHLFQTGEKNTSLGYRLQFSDYAKKLFLSSPVFGLGTSSFSYHFNQDKPIAAWGEHLLDPHNEYWLTAVEHGVVGLIILGYFYFTLFANGRRQEDTYPLMLGLLSTFLVASFFDSLLLFSGTGYFFVLFAAMGVGESLGRNSNNVRSSALFRAVPC